MRDVTWLVAGLGNPGREHAGTRHDLGFVLVERVAADLGARFDRDREVETAGPVEVPGSEGRVLLAKPQLYMNRSGPPLARLLARLRLPPERLLVACDDVNIALGRLRLRAEGSAGGHNGLRSIIESVGTGFPRLRLGVGQAPPGMDRADWVLSRFHPDERLAVRDMVERAAAAVRQVLERGVEATLGKVS